MRRWKHLTRACKGPPPHNRVRNRNRAVLHRCRLHPVLLPQVAQTVRPAVPPAPRAVRLPPQEPAAVQLRLVLHARPDPPV